eukprot:CAMPEP_0115194586 /NCGR_PEP_ID=MMETSP0270-20121206/14147_1 /TAXON_ID=71861 /ORGANISM="Scrippsiella trochoidea, Strain CCMP3099" /LENGTH=59 /DNA_ID=CAMNT_0002607893 /DNA_START=390 /DNA_END=566 /DNA_ORIENTATION=-
MDSEVYIGADEAAHKTADSDAMREDRHRQRPFLSRLDLVDEGAETYLDIVLRLALVAVG